MSRILLMIVYLLPICTGMEVIQKHWFCYKRHYIGKDGRFDEYPYISEGSNKA